MWISTILAGNDDRVKWQHIVMPESMLSDGWHEITTHNVKHNGFMWFFWKFSRRFQNKIYISGGASHSQIQNFESLTTLFQFDPISEEFQRLADMNVPRSGHGFASDNKKYKI